MVSPGLASILLSAGNRDRPKKQKPKFPPQQAVWMSGLLVQLPVLLGQAVLDGSADIAMLDRRGTKTGGAVLYLCIPSYEVG